jgi:hypothetical protein
MKSSFLIVLSIIAVSVACSGYKSAGSQPLANNNAQTQPSAQANTATTQEKIPCTLKLAGAPVINGLKLGMTTDEVLALFPGSKEDPDLRSRLAQPPTQFGTTTLVITPSKYETKEKFLGISQITLRSLDGRVYQLYVGFNGPEWTNVDKFVDKFVEGKNLPAADQWEAYVGMDNSLKVLKCAEFEVQAFVGGQGGGLNHVDVKDLLADKELKDRRAKARASASPTPKP